MRFIFNAMVTANITIEKNVIRLGIEKGLASIWHFPLLSTMRSYS